MINPQERTQWLAEVQYLDDDILQCYPLTNQQIIDLPPDQRPTRWFDPFDPQQLDNARANFSGSALDWSRWVESNLPHLDPKEEREKKLEDNRHRDARICGMPQRSVSAEGYVTKTGNYHCNRFAICAKCRDWRAQQITARLMRLEGLPVVMLTKEERAKMVKKYGKNSVLCISVDKGRVAVVINTTDEIEGSKPLSYDIAKNIAEHNNPSGSKISGNLGKVPKKPKDESEIVLEHKQFVIEAPEQEIKQMEEEMLQETADLLPTTPAELQNAIWQCEYRLREIAERHCAKIHFDRKSFFVIKEGEIDWTERQASIRGRPPEQMTTKLSVTA